MTMTPDPDKLLATARTGDRGSLAGLLECLGPEVRRRIVPKIPASMRAVLDEDDVMQVTYLEAVTRFDTFTSGDSRAFQAWLSRLAENNLIDAIRAMESAKRPDPRRRVSQPNSEESMVALVEMLGVTSTTPSIVARRGEMKTHLESALAALPADYARVIRLYDLAGRPPAEVAKELGRSEGAVFMLRARAHERLRDVLGSASKFFSIGS